MQGGLAALRHKTSVTAELVAFPHTIFALPFAFMGMLLGARGLPTAWQLGWIVSCMLNRIRRVALASSTLTRSISRTKMRVSEAGACPSSHSLVLVHEGMWICSPCAWVRAR